MLDLVNTDDNASISQANTLHPVVKTTVWPGDRLFACMDRKIVAIEQRDGGSPLAYRERSPVGAVLLLSRPL
jgi:hypothetical protein